MPTSPPTPEPAARVARWLLAGPAVVHRGGERGGVVGWVDDAGGAPFVYPEICGYHLSWLAAFAQASPEHRDAAASCAQGVIEWLEAHEGDHGRFVSRVYATPREDWRNRAEFTFDVGMILRGLDAVARDLPAMARPGLRGRCLDRLVGAAAEGRLGSHRLAPGATSGDLPRRWSTTPGPHLIKVAAALLGDSPAAEIARATIAHHQAALMDAAVLPPPHPALYAVEGLLQAGYAAGESRWVESAASLWRRVVAREVRGGGLPGPTQPPDPDARADVLAQALRSGRILEDIGQGVGRAPVSLDRLQEVLAGAVRPDGAVPFHYAAPRSPRQDNTWAAQFTWQALRGAPFVDAISRLI